MLPIGYDFFEVFFQGDLYGTDYCAYYIIAPRAFGGLWHQIDEGYAVRDFTVALSGFGDSISCRARLFYCRVQFYRRFHFAPGPKKKQGTGPF